MTAAPDRRTMTATTVTCTRSPCDSALAGHQLNSDGEVRHRTSVGSGDDWSVAITAWDDDPWCVDVELPETLWTFADVEAASRFGGAVQRASVWALKATMEEPLTHA